MQLLPNIHSRRVAIAIGVMGSWATHRDIFSARRLGKLPDIGKIDAALRGVRWLLRKRAPRRGRTGVVGYEIDDLAPAGVLANVVGGDDGSAVIFLGGNAGTVDSGAETGSDHAVDPGVDVGFLLGQHASPLFLIKKDDGVARESFAMSGRYRDLRIGFAERGRAGNGLQFCVEPTVE